MDIKAEIGRHTDEAEQIITSYLPEEKGYQKTVIEAMNYSFLAGGKRLRPILMLETYRLFGGKSKVIEPFMAAWQKDNTCGVWGGNGDPCRGCSFDICI